MATGKLGVKYLGVKKRVPQWLPEGLGLVRWIKIYARIARRIGEMLACRTSVYGRSIVSMCVYRQYMVATIKL